MLRTNLAITAACLACAGLIAPSASARDESRPDENTKALIDNTVTYAKRFEKSFKTALDQSSYKDSYLQNRLDDWAGYLNDQVKDMAHKYKEHGPYAMSPGAYLGNALIAAQGINRAVIAEPFPNIVRADWARLRDSLNRLAVQWNRPPVPARIGIAPAARVVPMETAPTLVLLRNIHEATKRFKDDFDDSVERSALGLDTKFYKGITSGLKSSTGRVLQDYQNNDMRDFRLNLQDTMVLSAALNRTMLTTRFAPATEAEWDSIRRDLNRLALAYGQPPLPEYAGPGYALTD